jgi:hypothetical protein
MAGWTGRSLITVKLPRELLDRIRELGGLDYSEKIYSRRSVAVRLPEEAIRRIKDLAGNSNEANLTGKPGGYSKVIRDIVCQHFGIDSESMEPSPTRKSAETIDREDREAQEVARRGVIKKAKTRIAKVYHEANLPNQPRKVLEDSVPDFIKKAARSKV